MAVSSQQVISEQREQLPDQANLGCGDDYREGWHNVDAREDVRTDEYADLDACPWPWADDTFGYVLMDNVIEHLSDRVRALQELARIVEPGGTVVLRYPHWNSPGAWTCPDHEGTLTRNTWENYAVADLFEIRDRDCTRVRFGRALPKPVAWYLSDHIGHIISEVEVTLEVTA